MKRFIALFLAILLLLCACGKDEPVETTAETTVPPTVPPTTVAPTTEPETVPPTEETEPPVNLIHPLTGEVLDEPYASRPVSVSPQHQPQHK